MQSIDLRNDKLALQRLKEAAEKAKIELSSSTQTEVNLPFITADQNGPKHLKTADPRQARSALVEDLVQRTVESRASGAEGCRPHSRRDRRGRLVGGMTRMPKIRRR